MIHNRKSDMLTVSEDSDLLTHEHIQQQLQSILSSPEFLATSQQREFLAFVIAETLAERSGNLKGYSVATEVFGRAPHLTSMFL